MPRSSASALDNRGHEQPRPQGSPAGIPRVEGAAAAGHAEVSSSTCCNTQRHEALWEEMTLFSSSRFDPSDTNDSLRLRSANDCSDSDSGEGSRLTTTAAAAPTYEITPALSWLRQKQGGGGGERQREGAGGAELGWGGSLGKVGSTDTSCRIDRRAFLPSALRGIRLPILQ